MIDLNLLAAKYKEQYNSTLNALKPEDKNRFIKIRDGAAVHEQDRVWYNSLIKEIAAKAEESYEQEINKSNKNNPK